MGPLNNEVVAARMDAHVADAEARGARLLLGGHREPDRPTGLYYEMTVIDGVTPIMGRVPPRDVRPGHPHHPLQHRRRGLRAGQRLRPRPAGVGLHGSSLGRAYRAVDELRTGTVLINEGTAFWEQHPPFGGASRTGTGWGRIGGKYTILDMTDLRTAIIDTGRPG